MALREREDRGGAGVESVHHHLRHRPEGAVRQFRRFAVGIGRSDHARAGASTGKVCFCWYRIKITAPPEWEGKKVELFTTVDDYGEVWIDDKLPFKVGQINGNLICGHNVPNHVELPDVKAGKIYQIAIFAINGPISASPKNWIFLHDTYLQISPKAAQ